MKIFVISRICCDGATMLPYSDMWDKGYATRDEAEKVKQALMEEEIIGLNEDGPVEAGWWYGTPDGNWVAKFDEDEDVREYITKYTVEEIEV